MQLRCQTGGKAMRWANVHMQVSDIVNVISYNAAMSACESGKQWLGSLRLLQELIQHLLAPDSLSCNAAIGACGQGHRWKQALELVLRVLHLRLFACLFFRLLKCFFVSRLVIYCNRFFW